MLAVTDGGGRPLDRIAVLYSDFAGVEDAIGAVSEGRAHALRASGLDARVFAFPDRGQGTAGHGDLSGFGPDAVVLEYNPFSYGRWGFSPRLPVQFGNLALLPSRPIRALMCHERFFMPMRGVKHTAMSLWQRAQLRALRQMSDVVFASIQPWVDDFARSWPHRPTACLPVTSTVPDRRSVRAATRAGMELDDNAILLCLFGKSHTSRLVGHGVAAINATHEVVGSRLRLLVVGADASAPPGLHSDITVFELPSAPAAEVSAALAASDVLVAPFADGVSTRRTTVMAALQHALPVVSTAGASTDSALSGAMRLVPVRDTEGFSRAVVGLAEDVPERLRLGQEGRELYERLYSWPRITQQLTEQLDGVRARH